MATETKKHDGGKKAVWFWTIAAVILLLIAFVWWKVPASSLAASAPKMASQENTAPLIGDFTTDVKTIVNPETDWSPAVKNDYRTILDEYHPLVKGVGWLIRIDKDPNKVYPMPPVDAPGKHFFDYTNTWTYIEWGLIPVPGQSPMHGKLAYHTRLRM